MLLAFLTATACGRGGENSSSDGGTPDPGGAIDDNPRQVSGTFFLGDSSQPAVGYELLLVDWSDYSIRSFLIDSDGSVTLQLSEFVEGRTYSFHLIKGDRKIGDLDLSAVNTGLQSAFAYRGGYGFSMGNVVIPLNSHGLIAVPEGGLPAAVGGGFSLADGSRSLKLEDVPVPSMLSMLSVQPTLVVSRADDLYHGFLNITEPSGATAVRARYAGFAVLAKAAPDMKVERIFNSRLSDWQSGSIVLTSSFADFTTGTPWSASSFHLVKTETAFSAEVLPGRSILNRLIFLKTEGEEPPQIEVPRVISSGFARPPVISAINLAGGVPQTVNYQDASQENGLIAPFCYSNGDLVLTFAAPTDLDGQAVDGTLLDQIALMPEYYTQSKGVTVPISTGATLPAPYNADIGEETDGDWLRGWTSADKTMTFSMTTGNMSDSSHTVTLPAVLFPSYLDGKVVTRIKMRYLFKAKSHPGKSGSVFWIRKNC